MASIDKRVYKVAGITKDADGTVKVRYSGEEFATRIKMYVALGCSVVEFIELPREMNKIEICEYLLKHELGQNAEYEFAIRVELEKKEALVGPKIPKKRGRKPKALTAATAVVTKPAKVAKVKTAVKQPKKAPAVKAPAKELGEIETLEVSEVNDTEDFDLREFQALASQQV